MKKPKKIPKDFGKALCMLIGWAVGNGYEQELANIQGEMVQKNGLLKIFVSKDEAEKNMCNEILGFSQSVLTLGLMIGYAFGQWYPFDHPGITEELNYLFSRMPGLKREETVFFTRDAFLKKLADIAEDKTMATMTEHEIEKAATAIVLCWPRNQEAIKDMARKFREGFNKIEKKAA
jgi:hypothetical protein